MFGTFRYFNDQQEQNYTGLEEVSQTNRLLVQLLQQQAAPQIELECYDGDPLEFKHFIKTFEQAVETKISDEQVRLKRLLQFTKGVPHELIRPDIYDQKGYTNAKRLLEVEYGSLHAISAAYDLELAKY